MTEFRVLTTCFAICLMGLGCTEAPRIDQDVEELKIRELDRQWLEAFVEKDIDTAMQFFAPDAVLMPSQRPAIVGRDSIHAWFSTWLPEPAISTTFAPDVIEVSASGDLAYDRGTSTFTLETPEGVIRDTGKYIVVWKKIEGEWKAILDISNSNLAAPEQLPKEES